MTKFAVRNPVTSLVVLFMLVIAGTVAYKNLPREAFPEVKVPLIFVNTVYPGASPEDIENLVTDKIEDKLEGLDGVKKVSSQSMESISAIQVEFDPDIEVDVALRRVKDKVDQAAGDLPPEAEDPLVQELNFSNIPVFIVSLSSTYPISKLETLADQLADDIQTIRGILDVKVTGKEEKEISVDVDQNQLLQYHLKLNDVVQAIQTQHNSIPGGIIRSGGMKFSIQLGGEFQNAEDFNDVIVRSENGRQIRLQDVAKVSLQNTRNRSTISRLNGQPSLAITVTKRTGENIIEIVDQVKALIDKQKKNWPEGTEVTYTFDQSKQIRHMVNELQNHIITGLILVVVIISLFLGFRNSFFISTAIPISMLIGFLALGFISITLNMVVLFSLVIALGMLVDDGIVVVENIFRHLQMGKSKIQASIDGTKEVAGPVTTATVTTVAAFLPIIFMPGIMGDFMKYLPITIAVTLTASLCVAFIFNPVFSSLFMVNKDGKKFEENENQGFQKFRNMYGNALKATLHHPILLLLGCGFFLISGIAAYVMFGKGVVFFPISEPEVVVAEIEGPLGIDIQETDKAIKKLEDRILNIPKEHGDLKNVQTVVGKGSAHISVQTQTQSHKSYIDISFQDYEKRKVSSWETMTWIDKNLPSELPGWKVKVKKQEDGPPVGSPVHFEITGPDFQTLSEISNQLMTELNQVPHLANIDWDYFPESPEVKIEVNRQIAMHHGLSVTDVSLAVRQAIQGVEAGTYRLGKDEFDVMVRLDTSYREDLNSLGQVRIFKDDNSVPLSTVASISQFASLASINHVNGNRTIQVTGEIESGHQDQSGPKKEAEKIAANLSIPSGYTIEKGSSNREQEETQAFLMNAFLVSMMLVFLAMVFQFNSIYQPFLIVAGIVVSLGGVFYGLLISHVTFSIVITGIGIISLAGIVAKNGIVLIDFINKLREEGHSLQDSVIEGSKTRIRPVLLTAITAMIGLLPMATGIGFDFVHLNFVTKSETSQFWAPMAWAIFWGLLFNTLITLFTVPVLYYTYERVRAKFKRQTV